MVASFLERSLSAVYAVVPRTHLDLDPAKAVAKGKEFFRPEKTGESLSPAAIQVLDDGVFNRWQAVLPRDCVSNDRDLGSPVGQDL